MWTNKQYAALLFLMIHIHIRTLTLWTVTNELQDDILLRDRDEKKQDKTDKSGLRQLLATLG